MCIDMYQTLVTPKQEKKTLPETGRSKIGHGYSGSSTTYSRPLPTAMLVLVKMCCNYVVGHLYMETSCFLSHSLTLVMWFGEAK